VARGPAFDEQAILYVLRLAAMFIHVINTDKKPVDSTE
jgi:hypothetical protein